MPFGPGLQFFPILFDTVLDHNHAMEKPEQTLQEQIAFSLSQKIEPGQAFAWVEHEDRIYYSRIPLDYKGPATAVTKLIQNLFDLKVDHSFFILRKRIFANYPLTSLCRGMIKIAAKRATGEITATDHQMDLNHAWEELGEGELLHSRHVDPVAWQAPTVVEGQESAKLALKSLIAQIPRGAILHDHNREIAVLICDEQGRLLEHATNSNYKNKTMHAEVTAIQNYFRRTGQSLPENTRIYVSLKPCVMCSAMISKLAPDSCQVIYFQDDPGPMAKNTELEQRGLLHECQ